MQQLATETTTRQRIAAVLRSCGTLTIYQLAARFGLEFAATRRLCNHPMFRIGRAEHVMLAASATPRIAQPTPTRATAKRFTAEEDAILRAEFLTVARVAILAERLGRRESSIKQRARQLGLRRDRVLSKAARNAFVAPRKMKERETAEPGV